MGEWGVRRAKSCSCMFVHMRRGLMVVVHGSDVHTVGDEEDLDWLLNTMKGVHQLKHRGRIGGGKGDTKSARVLNRIVEWRKEGIVVDADQRHIEIAAEVMGADGGEGGSNTRD